MVSAILIAITVAAALTWGDQYMDAPYWFRLGLMVAVTGLLLWSVFTDWEER